MFDGRFRKRIFTPRWRRWWWWRRRRVRFRIYLYDDKQIENIYQSNIFCKEIVDFDGALNYHNYLVGIFSASNGGIGSNDPEEPPDSLETSSKTVTAFSNATTASVGTGTIRSYSNGTFTGETPTSEADLLALLRIERRSQQATKRDYEILRKQYQRYTPPQSFKLLFPTARCWLVMEVFSVQFAFNRSPQNNNFPPFSRSSIGINFSLIDSNINCFKNRLKEELEWRDSGHGDDLAETEYLSTVISDRDRDSDSVQMKPSIALKSWTWRSSPR